MNHTTNIEIISNFMGNDSIGNTLYLDLINHTSLSLQYGILSAPVDVSFHDEQTNSTITNQYDYTQGNIVRTMVRCKRKYNPYNICFKCNMLNEDKTIYYYSEEGTIISIDIQGMEIIKNPKENTILEGSNFIIVKII